MKLRALITRPEEDAVPLAHALSESGIEVAVEPLLTVRPILDAAIELDGVQAVLFTSANGVRIFAQLAGERNLPGWRDLPAFTVGNASAAAAQTAGFGRVESASGDVAALAQLVAAQLDPTAGALFHGAGSAVAGDLGGSLAAAGFELRRSMIYEARPAERLSEGTIAALAEQSIDLVLLFSPRTAATFVSLASAAGDRVVAGCGRAAALCLSPAIANAVGDLPWRSVKSAARPDMPAMLELVAQYLEELGKAKGEAPAPSAEAKMIEENQTTVVDEVPKPSNAAMTTAPQLRRRDGVATALIAAVTAALVAVAFGAIWSQTMPAPEVTGQPAATIDPALAARLDEVDARIAAATKSVSEVGDRLEALSGTLETLKGVVAELQATGASGDVSLSSAGLKDRLTTIEQQFASFALSKEWVTLVEQQLAELKTQQGAVAQGASIDGAALERLSGENETLRAEIAVLKSQLEPLSGLTARIDALDLAVKEQSAGATNSALALAAGQLSATLATARAFSAELTALRDVIAADPTMAAEVERITSPLHDFAVTGIPTLPDLKSQFSRVAGTVAQLGTKSALTGLTGTESGDGWFDRALDRLSSVIIVRPVGDVPGDSPTARVARAEAFLQVDDLTGSTNELAELTGEPAAAVAEWLAAARARLSADYAIAALQMATIARLRPAEVTPLATDG